MNMTDDEIKSYKQMATALKKEYADDVENAIEDIRKDIFNQIERPEVKSVWDCNLSDHLKGMYMQRGLAHEVLIALLVREITMITIAYPPDGRTQILETMVECIEESWEKYDALPDEDEFDE